MSQFIEVIDNVLPDALCQELVEQIDVSPNRQPGRTGGGVDTSKKVSEDVSICTHTEFSALLPKVLAHTTPALVDYFAKYYFALIGPIGLTLKHPRTGEPVKLTEENFDEVARPNLPSLVQYLFRMGDINAQRYPAGKGGYPYWHSEVYPQAEHNDALHRILLFMYYLNDVEQGGETDFYYQDLSVRPKRGRMVIAPAYFTHTHRGQVPVSNDKYILTSWVLFNRAEQLYRGQ
ncbi:2OG-Fe(II) oxygenase [Lacimicrobium sp. SS2-24]|uniref:2OG-Fe(II) oxygenase n=1 Tax=Lacimicrobium sp. SS2-24 TaxID=2005569 RepID=UPI000B4B2450|nr:2OG-Fe(II) oxygenase [Lacimicrobium sp. SS2-24]